MTHPAEVHEEAVRLHEEHAQHCRDKGLEQTARLADERAQQARRRAIAARRAWSPARH
jgi:hypothetical protein